MPGWNWILANECSMASLFMIRNKRDLSCSCYFRNKKWKLKSWDMHAPMPKGIYVYILRSLLILCKSVLCHTFHSGSFLVLKHYGTWHTFLPPSSALLEMIWEFSPLNWPFMNSEGGGGALWHSRVVYFYFEHFEELWFLFGCTLNDICLNNIACWCWNWKWH